MFHEKNRVFHQDFTKKGETFSDRPGFLSFFHTQNSDVFHQTSFSFIRGVRSHEKT